MNIREALIASGIVTPQALKAVSLKPKAPRQKRKSRFTSQDILRSMRDDQRNRSNSGSATHEARFISAAGSDGHRPLYSTPNERLK